VNAGARHKLICDYAVGDASEHDSQKFDELQVSEIANDARIDPVIVITPSARYFDTKRTDGRQAADVPR
jgi:hypothetical protein